MTFYQIKTGILISQILQLEKVSQICGQDILVRVTSGYQVLTPTSDSVYITLSDFQTVQNQRNYENLNHGIYFNSTPERRCKDIKNSI